MVWCRSGCRSGHFAIPFCLAPKPKHPASSHRRSKPRTGINVEATPDFSLSLPKCLARPLASFIKFLYTFAWGWAWPSQHPSLTAHRTTSSGNLETFCHVVVSVNQQAMKMCCFFHGRDNSPDSTTWSVSSRPGLDTFWECPGGSVRFAMSKMRKKRSTKIRIWMSFRCV